MSAPDISELSTEQQESLQTYTSVTDQDPIAAIPILQRAEWNVQIAIARFFDGEPATDALAEARAALPPATSRQTTNLQYESLVPDRRPVRLRTPAENRVEKVDTSGSGITYQRPSWLLSILLTPFNIMYRVLTTIFSPLGFLVPSFVSRILHRLLTLPSQPARRSLPPADTARRFIRDFSEEYGGAQTLPFVEAGFNLSLDSAKRDFKFLLVILLSPSHDQTSSYVRETLLSSTFTSFLATHSSDILLWGGNIQDSEAYQVSGSLQCTQFPFCALICHTTDTGSSGMSVVMRATGPMSASELTAKLGAAITTQQPQLRGARAQQTQQQASRTLREEQDSAYERSLAQDRERTRRKREEQEAASRAEKDARAAAEADETRERQLAQWKLWRAASLAPEPGADVKDAIRVQIRMPSGDRVVRKLRYEAELEELYAFVECYDILHSGETDEKAQEPEGYEHVYRFRLVSPMPRTVYDMAQGGSVGEKIGKAGSLIVEPIEEEEVEP